jgi:hypothetical protein
LDATLPSKTSVVASIESQKEGILHSHRRGNLKFYNLKLVINVVSAADVANVVHVILGPGFDSQHYQKKSGGSGTGSTQPREYN